MARSMEEAHAPRAGKSALPKAELRQGLTGTAVSQELHPYRAGLEAEADAGAHFPQSGGSFAAPGQQRQPSLYLEDMLATDGLTPSDLQGLKAQLLMAQQQEGRS